MINDTMVSNRKMARGAILRLLNDSQSPTLVNTIEISLAPIYQQISSEMVPAINYLVDRGYIRVTDTGTSALNPMRGMMVRISDKGQDVVDHTTDDPGIILPRD